MQHSLSIYDLRVINVKGQSIVVGRKMNIINTFRIIAVDDFR